MFVQYLSVYTSNGYFHEYETSSPTQKKRMECMLYETGSLQYWLKTLYTTVTMDSNQKSKAQINSK